jgi:WD40 repeat protein
VVPTCVRVARRALSGFFAANVTVVRCQCTQRDPLNDDDGARLREVRRPRVVVAMLAMAMMRVIVRFAPQHALAASFVLGVVDWRAPAPQRTAQLLSCWCRFRPPARRRPPHSVTMVRERVVCAIWDDDAPPTHVVTRVAVVVDDAQSRVRRSTTTTTTTVEDEDWRASVRGARDDASMTTTSSSSSSSSIWVWTGARDGGIIRWRLGDALASQARNSSSMATLGAVNYCAAHESEIIALVSKGALVVSVDSSSVMCAWEHSVGHCLHMRKIPRNITTVEIVEMNEELVIALGARASGPHACSQVHVCDPLSERVLVLDAPREFSDISKIKFEKNGDICAFDVRGNAYTWTDTGALAAGYGADVATPEPDAFDLTGWSNIAKPIIQSDKDIDSLDSFEYTIDSEMACVDVRGDEANCTVTFKGVTYSLSDRWDAEPNVAVTSCVLAKGGQYAPELSIFGYSNGTIKSKPLSGSDGQVVKFCGHQGAVLSILDWVSDKGQNFLISGGKDGTVRAWDYKTAANVAILRHHQGPVRLILPAPTSARNGNWNDIFITIGDDGVLGLVSANTWVVNFIMPGNGLSVKEIVWNAPRGVLAVLSKDNSLHVWDILTGALERHLTGAAAAAMNNYLREGSFYTTLHDSAGLVQRTWQSARKRLRPIAWRCMQPSILAVTANVSALLEPTKSGLPSHGVKRRGANMSSIRAENLPISGFFNDEEERALHFVLGMLYPSSELDDSIFCKLLPRKSLIAKIAATGARGSVTFDLPGVNSALAISTTRELRLIIMSMIVRIVQVCEGLNLAPYSALAAHVESVGDDADLAFYAQHRMDSIECVREASKQLLRKSLEHALPKALHFPVPHNLLSSEYFKTLDRVVSNHTNHNSSTGLLGLIIASTACVIPDSTMDPSWNAEIPRILLECLQSSEKNIVFTSASLLTEGMHAMNWWRYLPDPNKALEDVFKLSSTIAEKSMNPTESMIYREALSDLLSAFAKASPPYFFTHMNSRLRTLNPEHPAHMLAFMALIRVAQTDVAILQLHAAFLMETVILALNPANSSLRKCCLQGAYALLTELGKSSSMAFHRETQRFAAAMHGAVKGGTLMVIYDLQTATKWRTLEDRHNDSMDKSVDENASDWSNPLSYIVSPEKSVKHSPNVLVDKVKHVSIGSSDSVTDAGELSVKAVSFDADGNQIAAYLDKLSFVYVWDLTTSWRHTFTRGALSLGTSHYMPCVPSEAPLHSHEFGKDSTVAIKCSLTFVKSRQLRLVHGEVDMVFSFVC